MAVPSTINDFPASICITKLSTKQIFPRVYYSNRVEAEYLEATVTVALTDIVDVEAMQQFWYSELVNMYYPFRMNLPLFGASEEYTVRMVSDLTDTWKDGIFPKEETFTVQILDNIETKFNKNRLDVLIEVDGGQVTFVVDNEVHVDWGDGIIKQYEGGVITDTPFHYIRITSLEEVTSIKFIGSLIKGIDVVKALDLTTAEDMCRDLAYMEAFSISYTPNLTNTNSMFENTTKLLYAPNPADGTDLGLDLTNVTTATKMYKGSGIITVDMDTSNIEVFTEMLMNAVDLQCISRLNTLLETDTTDMFTNTPMLVYPDAADKALILAGADWVNDQYCPFFVTRYLQNLLYDETNIVAEFTTLTNASTYGNKVKATDYDSEAISLPLSTVDTNKRITSVKDGTTMAFKGAFEYETIDNGDSIADTLVTDLPIVDGDNLVIVLADNSVTQIVASGVSSHGDDNPSTTTIVPTMTSNILPSGTAFATSIHSGAYDAFQAFNGNTTYGWISIANTTLPVVIGYINDMAYSINKYIVTGNGGTLACSPKDWTLEGSNDTTTGLDGTWDTLDTITDEIAWTANEVRTFTMPKSDEYLAFRINVSANNGDDQVAIEELVFIEASYVMDTTSTTAGEIPEKIYAVDSEVAFDIGTGYRAATVKDATYTTGSTDLLALNDPFLDGSLVARYKLNGDALESVGGDYSDGVNTNVTWFNDSEKGLVGDFSVSLSKIQTDLRTSDLDSTYTIVFSMKRHDVNNYDIPYVESGAYGAFYIFEGKDSSSFNDNNGGMHKNTDAPRIDMYSYNSLLTEWGMYGYGRTNGVTNGNYMNGLNIIRKDAGFATQVSSNPLQIGSDGSFKIDDEFNGYISDFMVFNRELTDAEHLELYLAQGTNLAGLITYEDVVDDIGSQTIETRVRLKNIGDVMITLSGELHGVEETTVSTNCWTPLTQLISGWYGYDEADSTVTVLEPDLISDYTNIYAYKFEGTYGEFRASFGVDGDWQLHNTALLVYQHPLHGNVELYWDSVNNDYRGFNLELATSIIASDVGIESCFTSLAIPYNAVEYDFTTLNVEV